MSEGTPFSRLNRPQKSPLMDASMEAIERVVSRIYYGPGDSRRLPITQVQNEYALRKLAMQEAGKLTFPCLALTLQTMGPAENGYNAEATRRYGFRIQQSENKDFWTIMSLQQVQLEVQVRFMCQARDHLHHFADRWMFNRYQFSLMLEAPDITVEVAVNPDLNLSVPTGNMEELGMQYRMDTRVTAVTWVGDVLQVPSVLRIDDTMLTLSRDNSLSYDDLPDEVIEATRMPQFSVSDPRLKPQ